MDALEWWRTVYPRLDALGVKYREVMQEAGDMIYVPAGGWYHQVRVCILDIHASLYSTRHRQHTGFIDSNTRHCPVTNVRIHGDVCCSSAAPAPTFCVQRL